MLPQFPLFIYSFIGGFSVIGTAFLRDKKDGSTGFWTTILGII
jgi:hypothetical protein